MAAKKSTLAKAQSAVSGAAKSAVKAVNKRVVKPVGKALGLTGTKKSGGKKKTAARKGARKK